MWKKHRKVGAQYWYRLQQSEVKKKNCNPDLNSLDQTNNDDDFS